MKKMFLIFTLLVSLFTLALTNKVNAEEISDDFYAGDEIRTALLVVQNSDGSEEETLVDLTEVLVLYGADAQIAVVSEEYSDENCIVIGNLDDLTERFGEDGRIVIVSGESEVELGNVGDLGGTCETNKIIVTKDDEKDPDNVGICTIGQLVSLS